MNFEVNAISISSAAADHNSKFLVRYSLFLLGSGLSMLEIINNTPTCPSVEERKTKVKKERVMSNKLLVPAESVITKIVVIKNQKVILDRDLAALYGVETRALKQAVRRNIKRFPEDFMFQLGKKEIDQMVSQTVIPSKSYFGGANPMAFTEQGVAMLSSVLKSERAIEVNILIMRAFVKLREIISTHKKVEEKLKDLESKLKEHDDQIVEIVQVINQLIAPPETPKKKIGFTID